MRSDVSDETKRRITLEIKKISAGVSGEQGAAFEIDSRFGVYKNFVGIM